MSPLGALLVDVLLTALWPLVGHAGVRHFSPLLFVQFGLLSGLLCLAPWLACRGRWRSILSRELRLPLFWVGLLGSAIPSVLFILALEYTTPANAAVMAQSEVLYSAALSSWLLGERIGPAQAAASLLVVGGTGLLMLRDLSTARWKGDLLVLIAPWSFQAAHIVVKRLPARADALTIAGGRLFFGTLSLLPLSLWALARGARASWNAESCALILTQGVGLYALNHVLWYAALRGMDLAKATAIMLSYPALSALLSRALGLEDLSAWQLSGLALTFCGAWWLSRLSVAAPVPSEKC